MTTCNCGAVSLTVSRTLRRRLKRGGVVPATVQIHAHDCPFAVDDGGITSWSLAGRVRSQHRNG